MELLQPLWAMPSEICHQLWGGPQGIKQGAVMCCPTHPEELCTEKTLPASLLLAASVLGQRPRGLQHEGSYRGQL